MTYRSATLRFLPALLLSALPVGTAFSAEVFLSLKVEAKVSQTEIRLGEIADIVAANISEKSRLESLNVARLPSIGSSKRLTRSEIEYGLQQGNQNNLPTIVWGGAEHVFVSGKSQLVNLTPGVEAAAVFLLNRIGGDNHVSLRVIRSMDKVEAPPGAATVSPDFSSIHTIGSYIDVPLIVEIDGSKTIRTSVRFQVVPRADGKTLASDNAEPPGRSSPKHDSDASRADGNRPLVGKDQAVTLLIDTGGVRVETTGVALNDAKKGEKVRVRRISGGAEIVGRVMQRGVVIVDEI